MSTENGIDLTSAYKSELRGKKFILIFNHTKKTMTYVFRETPNNISELTKELSQSVHTGKPYLDDYTVKVEST